MPGLSSPQLGILQSALASLAPYGLMRSNFLHLADSCSKPFKDSQLPPWLRPDVLTSYPETTMIRSSLGVPFSSQRVQSCLLMVPKTNYSLHLCPCLHGIPTTSSQPDTSLCFKDQLMWHFHWPFKPTLTCPFSELYRTFWTIFGTCILFTCLCTDLLNYIVSSFKQTTHSNSLETSLAPRKF